MGHLLHSGPELGHVAGDHHGIVPGVEATHRIVKAHVRSQGDELVPFPGLDVGHQLKAVAQADVHIARRDGFPSFLEADATRSPAPLYPVGWLGAHAQVILGDDASHQLAGKVVRKVRSHCAIYQLEELRMF